LRSCNLDRGVCGTTDALAARGVTFPLWDATLYSLKIAWHEAIREMPLMAV